MTELTMPVDGPSTSTSDILSYNPLGQVASEAQASGVTVHYDYYAASDNSGTASPGSIKDMQLIQGGQVISETDYAYDPSSKRLATITVNGNGQNQLFNAVSGSIHVLAVGWSNEKRGTRLRMAGRCRIEMPLAHALIKMFEHLPDHVIVPTSDIEKEKGSPLNMSVMSSDP